jgi:hypothetical protein
VITDPFVFYAAQIVFETMLRVGTRVRVTGFLGEAQRDGFLGEATVTRIPQGSSAYYGVRFDGDSDSESEDFPYDAFSVLQVCVVAVAAPSQDFFYETILLRL